MTTVQRPAPPSPPLGDTLAGQKLALYALPALAVATVAVTLLLFAFTGFAGRAGFLVVASLLYVLGQTVLSFRVEGRRQAVDRLCTTLVYVAFLLAALPLVLIIAYTVKEGFAVLSSDFLTQLDVPGQPGGPGRGRLPRDRRHVDELAAGDPDRRAARHPGRDLPGGVRRAAPVRAGDQLLRRRHDRCAVDRGRPVHLRVLDPRARLPEVRLRRRAGVVHPDAADRHPVHRGDAQAGAERPA